MKYMQKTFPKNEYPTLGSLKTEKNSQKSPTYAIIKGMRYNGQGGPGPVNTMPVQPPTTNLMPGMSGPEVAKLQNWLIALGYKIPDGPTGYFGDQTKAALTKYQADNAINTQGNPGYFGPITREFIIKSKPAGSSSTPTGTGSSNTSGSQGSTSGKSLIRFTSDPNGPGAPGDQNTVWYVDTATKTMRPVMSDQALMDLFGENYQNAVMRITPIDPGSVLPGGSLSDYTLLDQNYGIYENRYSAPLDFSPAAIKYTYGKSVTPDENAKAAQTIDGWMGLLKQNLATSGLSQKTIDDTLNDKVTLAAYISAIAYGGYTPMDIYMDMKRRELAQGGDSSMASMKVIDQNYNKRDYQATQQGSEAVNKLNSYVPGRIGSLDRAIFSSTLAQMPQSFYQATFPELNPESSEFKAKMDEIKSTLHESILQSISAKTDAEKAAADFVWKNTKEQFEKTYGIQLSDNALQAWNQIQQIEASYAGAGLSGSGLESEAVDDSLRLARSQNDRVRDTKTQKELEQTMTYYKASASPEEIQKLNLEDQAKGLPRDQWRTVQWGLAPKVAMTSAQFIADWKAKNPNATSYTDAEIKAKYYDPFYDDNGNFRSTLYQKKQDNTFKTTYGYDPGAIPSTSLKDYQTGMVLAKAEDDIKKNEAWKTASDPYSNDPQNSIGNVNVPKDLQTSAPNPPSSIGNVSTGTGTASSGNQLSPEQREAMTKQLESIKASLQGLQAKAATMGTGTTTPGSTTSYTPPATPTAKKQYVVQGGDTLTGISKKLFGDSSQYAKLGYSGDPTKLQIGTVLYY